MSDDKKQDDFDLDSILSEINSTISKEVSKTNSVKSKKSVSNSNTSKDSTARKPKTPKPTTPKPKINSVFADSAKIIEHAVEDSDEDLYSDHAVRFIAVTASEVVEDYKPKSEPPAPPPQEDAVISIGSILSGESEAAPISISTDQPAAPKVAPADDITRENNRHIKKLRKKKNRPVMSKRQKFTAVIGFLMTVLVIVGIVSIVIGTGGLTYRAVDQTALKSELSQAIFPFTIIDIPEFDDVKKLDNSAIISSAIWAFIVDDIDKTKYKQDDLGIIYVPDVDIELYIRNLFGNEIPIKHQTVEGSSVMMNYDEQLKTYSVESTPKILPYRPRVDKIQKKDDIYTLTVSYILPDAMWNFEGAAEKAVVDKTMKYVLKKNKSSYQVISVKLLSIAGNAASTPPTAPEGDEFDNMIDEPPESFVELSSAVPANDADPANAEPASDATTSTDDSSTNTSTTSE